MARSEGLEPSTKVLETLVLPGKLRTHLWSERWDLNPQPTVWKTATLPLSYVRIM